MIKITLPIPHPKLWGNRNTHWRSAAPLKKAYRKGACQAMEAQMKRQNLQPNVWETASLSLQYYFKDWRKRDVFNAQAAMKAAIDGCVDAGLLPDDDWQRLEAGPAKGGYDKRNPRVIMTFTRLDV